MKVILNPNWSKEQVAEFRAAIKNNMGYCPCAAMNTDDTECMCKDFREQDHPGPCFCGLYVKEED